VQTFPGGPNSTGCVRHHMTIDMGKAIDTGKEVVHFRELGSSESDYESLFM
jgi:hypothetical protein